MRITSAPATHPTGSSLTGSAPASLSNFSFWIEAIDANNVPDGVPLSYRLAYSRPLADRVVKARDEIMSGKPQQGEAAVSGENENQKEADAERLRSGARAQPGATTLDLDQFRLLQQAQRVEFGSMPAPLLPPKAP